MTSGARLLLGPGLRGFVEGVPRVLFASYLTPPGFAAFEVGAIVTATLVGSAVVTIVVGLGGHRVSRKAVLLAACGLMVITGIAFVELREFWPLLVVAFVGK